MSVELEKAGLDRTEKITKIANMTPVYSFENESISEVIEKIIQTKHRSFPIISKNKELVGLVTIMDILNAFLKRQYMKDKISAIMSRDVIYCNSNDSIEFVLHKFKLTRRGRFPILDNKKPVGIITERDLVKNFSEINFEISVREKMTKKPFFMEISTDIFNCLKSCINTRYRRLPIVNNKEEKKLMGIITVTDMLRYIFKNNYDFLSLTASIETILIKNVFYISPGSDLSDAIQTFKEKDIGGLPVVENGVLIGFITERDILEEIV